MEDWKTDVTEMMRQMGQSRTIHHILDALATTTCPLPSQLDVYYAENLHGPAAVELHRHLAFCNRCARELLLREQITQDLIEDESMELMKAVYATDAPASKPARRYAHHWLGGLAERKAFMGVAAGILFLFFLMLLFLWSRV